MKLQNAEQIIGRIRYNTATSTLLADDCYWDGHNRERGGRNKWLFRSQNGRYFFHHQTQWQGESDGISPCTKESAESFFESCMAQGNTYFTFEEAFPGAEIVDA